MNCFDQAEPAYKALEIACNYFIQCGYWDSGLRRRLMHHIIEPFNKGERRALMLANRAIAHVERENAVERELRAEMLSVWF
jgi:hypothetical protein